MVQARIYSIYYGAMPSASNQDKTAEKKMHSWRSCETSMPRPAALSSGSARATRAAIHGHGCLQRVAKHMRDGRELGLRLGLTDGEFAALHSLQRREYWNRVWVVQEASTVGVPREIWCGEKRVAF